MTCNVGNTDRILRFVLGAVLLLIAVAALTGAWAWVAGIVGAVMIATAATRFCPAYLLIGLKT
jgi:uncharacterized membrane protein YkgB